MAMKKYHSVTVRFRTGGERIKLPKRQGTHELKKLFQEWCIPPWQRNLVPLIYGDEKLVAVAGYTEHVSFEKDKHSYFSYRVLE